MFMLGLVFVLVSMALNLMAARTPDSPDVRVMTLTGAWAAIAGGAIFLLGALQ